MHQELIPGDSHVRAHCFGDVVVSVLIESDALDWRQNLVQPAFACYLLPHDTERQLLAVVRALGLRMGIIDLKLDSRKRPIWLEINRQVRGGRASAVQKRTARVATGGPFRRTAP